MSKDTAGTVSSLEQPHPDTVAASVTEKADWLWKVDWDGIGKTFGRASSLSSMGSPGIAKLVKPIGEPEIRQGIQL